MMLNLIIALMLTACADTVGPGAVITVRAINWTEFEAQADSAIERAAVRADAKYGVCDYRAVLDSLIHANHQEFQEQLKQGHINAVLLDYNLLLADKRERLKEASRRSRAWSDGWREADLYLNKWAYGNMLCDLLALNQAIALEAGCRGDSATANKSMRKADYLRLALIDWLVELRKAGIE